MEFSQGKKSKKKVGHYNVEENYPLENWERSSQESHYSISKTKNASSNANVREYERERESNKIPERFALIFCRSELTALSRIPTYIPEKTLQSISYSYFYSYTTLVSTCCFLWRFMYIYV